MLWSITAKAYSIGAVVMVGVASGCASSPRPPTTVDRVPAVLAAAGGTTGGSAGQIPGTDPAIQRWLLDNAAARIAFNDALLRAERGVAANTSSQCKPLSTAIQLLVKVLPKLATLSPAGQKLAAAIQPPLTTFDSAATACLAMNFPAARIALDAGVVQQADSQATVDEILDGDL